MPLQSAPAFEIVTLSWLVFPARRLVGEAFVETLACVLDDVPPAESEIVCGAGTASRCPLGAAGAEVGLKILGSVEASCEVVADTL